MQQGCFFFFHYFLANTTADLAKLFTDLLFYAYVGIHKVRILVFEKLSNVSSAFKMHNERMISCVIMRDGVTVTSHVFCWVIGLAAQSVQRSVEEQRKLAFYAEWKVWLNLYAGEIWNSMGVWEIKSLKYHIVKWALFYARSCKLRINSVNCDVTSPTGETHLKYRVTMYVPRYHSISSFRLSPQNNIMETLCLEQQALIDVSQGRWWTCACDDTRKEFHEKELILWKRGRITSGVGHFENSNSLYILR